MRFSRKTAVILHDLFMAALAWQLSWLVRFNFEFVTYADWRLSFYVLPLVMAVQGSIAYYFGFYKGLWRFASLTDLWNITRSSILGALSITLILFISNRLEGIPRSILLLYPVLLIFLLGGPRFAYRFWKGEGQPEFRAARDARKILIVGAGSAGEILLRETLRLGTYHTVAFVDDDPKLKNTEVHGVPVAGVVGDIAEVCRQYEVDLIVIAAPSASDEQMQKIIGDCETAGVPVHTLPKLHDLIDARAKLGDLKAVSVEDLLGREKIELDWGILRQGIDDKVVMVSGGGGSIGSELCLQIAALNPARLIVYDHSEINLHELQMKMRKIHPDLSFLGVLGSVCDRADVARLLSEHKPDLIFHAAAYKHVPILQDQVVIAVRNNVFGAKVLAELAVEHGCKKFVLISTDKAVNPGSALGASKRIAELYCEWIKHNAGETGFITVRFGNVLGSSGSVAPLFEAQIREGGPVTVTHPEVTRFFMTIREACQLILQASTMGSSGEIFVLDMGKPVKIDYLARQMIRFSGKKAGEDIELIYTGLRDGEKLHEELFYDFEERVATRHEKILLARHPDMDWQYFERYLAELEQAVMEFDDARVAVLFERLMSKEFCVAKSAAP